MIKQNWKIDEEERSRILELHESRTKKLYLKEQTISKDELRSKVEFEGNNPVIVSETFTFNFNFKTGFHSANATGADNTTTIKDQVENVILGMNNLFEKVVYPRIASIQISSGESAVPNRDNELPERPRLARGELARMRSDTIKNLITPAMNKLVEDGVIRSVPEITVNEPVLGTSTVKDSEEAIKEQFIRVSVVVEGLKPITPEETSEVCDLQLRILVEYKRVNFPDPKYHNCNDAIFKLLLNGITVPRQDGSENFSLNNYPSGDSVSQTLVVEGDIVQQILNVSDNVSVSFRCESSRCHEAPLQMTIFSLTNGKKISGPTYMGTAKKKEDRMGKGEERKVATMDKCGKLISIEDYYKGASSNTEKK